uniref:VWFA domain-containing protein n=1 Tax=Chelonoidis abingdonii TaxID=106734 RepID=A0A8C0GH15_CHEAB
FPFVSSQLGCVDTEEADIYFLIDGSGSIYPNDFQDMKVFMNEMISMFQVSANGVRFGVVQYESTPQTEFTISQYNSEFQLNQYGSKADLRRAISGIRQIKSGTMTGKALTFASSYFDEPKGGRPRVKQYLIVITDGEAQDIVREPAETIRDKGITIYAIGVLHANNSQLVEIAGSQDRVFFEDNFDSLTFLEKEILFEICNPEDFPHFPSPPGSCVPPVPPSPCARVSLSSLPCQGLYVHPHALFPHYFLFIGHRRTEVCHETETSTFTGKGLRFVKSFFETPKGGRKKQGVLQSLVVITDGQSNDVADEAAIALRNDGIHIFAIGIGIPNSFELLRIAGDARRVYVLENFEVLKTIERKIVTEICELEDRPSQGKSQKSFIEYIY